MQTKRAINEHTHRKKKKQTQKLTDFCWGYLQMRIQNRIHGRKCKVCFTLKVGSNSSFKAISSQPKMKMKMKK